MYINVQSQVIRLPTGVHAFLSSIRKYTHELTVDGRLPTDEELGDKLGATVQKIQVRVLLVVDRASRSTSKNV